MSGSEAQDQPGSSLLRPRPLKDVATQYEFTNDARQLLERAQRHAATWGDQEVLPAHVLEALRSTGGMLVHRALAEVGARLDPAPVPLPVEGADRIPIGPAVQTILSSGRREAELVGHRRLDAVHIVLGLLYRDSPVTSAALGSAGLSIYELRMWLKSPSASAMGTARLERPKLALPHLNWRVHPIFLGLVGLWVACGAGLAVGLPRFPLGLLFLLSGWLVSVCIHEFAHAITAFYSGDRSVALLGYLTLNPLEYVNPLFTLVMPVVFLLIGGIPLPGASVTVNLGSIRSRRRTALVAAAGPLATLGFLILLGLPFLLRFQEFTGSLQFWAAVAFLAFIEAFAFVFNLLPVPGFDGWGIIEPWLPYDFVIKARAAAGWITLILFVVLFTGALGIGAVLFSPVVLLTDLLQIPSYLIAVGRTFISLVPR